MDDQTDRDRVEWALEHTDREDARDILLATGNYDECGCIGQRNRPEDGCPVCEDHLVVRRPR